MIFVALFLATCFLAYSNGANDNFKGVASLFGSRTCNYWTAISWATVTTFVGSIMSIFLAQALLTNCQRSLNERFRLDEPALRIIENGQIVEDLRDLRMGPAQRALANHERAFEQVFCLAEPTLGTIYDCHVVECCSHVRTVLAGNLQENA